MRVINPDHRLIAHKLTYLRDKRTDSPTFRRLAEELMTLLAYEATRDVRVEPFEIETPVAPTTGIKLCNPKPLIVPILRAGLGMLEGMVRLLPSAEVGFLGMQRDEETLQAITYANRLPDDLSRPPGLRARPDAGHRRLDGRRDQVPHRAWGRRHHRGDPAQRARGHRPPAGGPWPTSRRRSPWSPVPSTSGSTTSGYIVPGLGDAGDRLYGLAQYCADATGGPWAGLPRHAGSYHPSHPSHLGGWSDETCTRQRPDAGGHGMPPIKKIVMWLVVIFLLYAIFTAPTEAANMFQAAWDFTVNAVSNIAQFFNSLIKG